MEEGKGARGKEEEEGGEEGAWIQAGVNASPVR